MEYMDYISHDEPHGMLRGYNDLDLFSNTTSPTAAPTEMPSISKTTASYTQLDKNFIGMFMIFPFTFAVVTGALSGLHTSREEYDTPKFHMISKGALLAYSMLTAGFSLDYGSSDDVSSDHMSAVGWILVSVPVAFSVVESNSKEYIKKFLAPPKEN